MAVILRHGANEVTADYSGFTIEQIRRELAVDTEAATQLNLPEDKVMTAVVFLNGDKMTDAQEREHRVKDGDKIEFSKDMVKSKTAVAC